MEVSCMREVSTQPGRGMNTLEGGHVSWRNDSRREVEMTMSPLIIILLVLLLLFAIIGGVALSKFLFLILIVAAVLFVIALIA
jgi:predicted RND superfamily exporter protein